MKVKLKDIADLVSGKTLGDPNTTITGVSNIEDAKQGDLSFVLDRKNLKAAERSAASAVVAGEDTKTTKPAILVKNPRLALAIILEKFKSPLKLRKGIHKTLIKGKNVKIGSNASIQAHVNIGNNVKIGKGAKIYPNVYIGNNVSIGEGCILYPNVVIYDQIIIGNNVILHAGTVIGVDGYGFVFHEGRHKKIPQVGTVIIEDDVEIYSNTCVARGTLGATLIKKGAKIDNLTHLAHNCKVGESCALTALLGFAGSVTLGDRVFVGGQAGFNGHINVGENTIIMAKAGVTKDIPPNSVISGFPAQEHKKEMEMQAFIHMLPKLFKKVEELEKKLNQKGPSPK